MRETYAEESNFLKGCHFGKSAELIKGTCSNLAWDSAASPWWVDILTVWCLYLAFGDAFYHILRQQPNYIYKKGIATVLSHHHGLLGHHSGYLS